jgi:hypothetical protein
MILKLDRDQLAAELAALDRLLAELPANDYLGRIGLQARREEIAERFHHLAHVEERRAKVALYFGGEPVIGSIGVQARFGTNALGTFQDLLSKVWGATERGQLSAMGPIKDKLASQLHITNLVHGSFGFLLEELDEEGEPLFETSLSKAADQVADYIASFAGEDERRFSQTIEEMNPRVFQSLRNFFGSIYRGKATFRLVEGERDERFDHLAVERAWHRAEESSVEEDRTQVEGRLLGIIPMRRRFEFEPDGAARIIEGKVGEQFSHTYLERISTEQFAGRRWRAFLDRRVVTKVGRQPYEAYTLLELEELEPPER